MASELLGLFSRVRRAASSLQMQSDEPVVASYGLAKTATLAMLGCSWIETNSRTRPARRSCRIVASSRRGWRCAPRMRPAPHGRVGWGDEGGKGAVHIVGWGDGETGR